MTEFEYQELLIGTSSLVTELVSVFISVLVAYLACAYLVGNKLTRFQLFAVSFTYSMFSLLLILLVYGNLMRMAGIKASFFLMNQFFKYETSASTYGSTMPIFFNVSLQNRGLYLSQA